MLVDGHLRADSAPDMELPVLILDITEAEATVTDGDRESGPGEEHRSDRPRARALPVKTGRLCVFLREQGRHRQV